MDPTVSVQTDIRITANAKGCLLGDIFVNACDHDITIQAGRRWFWAGRGFVTKFTKAAFSLPSSASPGEARSTLSEDGILTVCVPAKNGTGFTEDDRVQVVPVPWTVANDCGEHHVIPTVRPTIADAPGCSSTLPAKGFLYRIEERHGATQTPGRTVIGSCCKLMMPAESDAKPTANCPTSAPQRSSTYDLTSVDMDQPRAAVLTSDTDSSSQESLETSKWPTGTLQGMALSSVNCEPEGKVQQCDELAVTKHDGLPTAPIARTSPADSVKEVLAVPRVSAAAVFDDSEHCPRRDGIFEECMADGNCSETYVNPAESTAGS